MTRNRNIYIYEITSVAEYKCQNAFSTYDILYGPRAVSLGIPDIDYAATIQILTFLYSYVPIQLRLSVSIY